MMQQKAAIGRSSVFLGLIALIIISVSLNHLVFVGNNDNSSKLVKTTTLVAKQTTVVSEVQLVPTTVTATSTAYQTVTRIISGAASQCGFITNCNTQDSLGLELALSVNATKLQPNDNVLVNITVLNALSTVNNVSSSDSWPISGLALGPCPTGAVAGISVYQGYYALNNLSDIEKLQLWPLFVPCVVPFIFNGTTPVGVFQNATSYSFLPKSDMANYSAYYIPDCQILSCPSLIGKFSMSMNATLNLYAINSTNVPDLTVGGASLRSAAPSIYTLVAGDEWGDIVLLHFSVV
ncbi:MAG: hypothetical protein ACREBS_09530 [Nitrososphaerales archaeon]